MIKPFNNHTKFRKSTQCKKSELKKSTLPSATSNKCQCRSRGSLTKTKQSTKQSPSPKLTQWRGTAQKLKLTTVGVVMGCSDPKRNGRLAAKCRIRSTKCTTCRNKWPSKCPSPTPSTTPSTSAKPESGTKCATWPSKCPSRRQGRRRCTGISWFTGTRRKGDWTSKSTTLLTKPPAPASQLRSKKSRMSWVPATSAHWSTSSPRRRRPTPTRHTVRSTGDCCGSGWSASTARFRRPGHSGVYGWMPMGKQCDPSVQQRSQYFVR